MLDRAKHKRFSGFTLVELLIVIAIVGILVTGSVLLLNQARGKSRDAKRVADMKQIATALELYLAEEGSYPATLTPGQPLVGPTSGITFMAKVPQNPTPRNDGSCADAEYAYTYANNSYGIVYCLGGATGGASAGGNTAKPGDVASACVANCTGKCSGDADGCGGTCTGVCTWQTVGAATFSTGQASDISLFVDSGGTPYVSYRDWTAGTGIVKTFNGSAWVNVGAGTISTSTATLTSIYASGGTPYVIFRDLNVSPYPPLAKSYNGSSWVTLGTISTSGDNLDSFKRIAVYSGTLYVAYNNTDVFKANVKTWNGSTWSSLGAADFSPGSIADVALVIDSGGTPYVSFKNSNTPYKATVMSYNGASWANVGSANFTPGAASSLSLDVYSNTPYVAYSDGANGNKASVMKYNGSAWVNVGSAGFSAAPLNRIYISISASGTPYVAFVDNGYSVRIMKFDGSVWATVGTDGFGGGNADYVALYVYGETPYIAYSDGASRKLTAKKYGP